MLTRTQIVEADGKIDEIARMQIVTAVRASDEYRQNAGRYPNLEGRLDGAGKIAAKTINAALQILEGYGGGTVALKGGDDGLDYSIKRDREEMVKYVLSVLYDSPVTGPTSAAAVIEYK